MRLLLAVLLFIALPAVAYAQATAPEPTLEEEEGATRRGPAQSCGALASQIARFEDVRERARARGNELWEQATVQHLGRLRQQQIIRCPEDVPPSFAQQLAELLGKIGAIALTAASLGAL